MTRIRLTNPRHLDTQGQRIRRLCDEHGVLYSEAAKAIGSNRQHLNYIMHDKRKATPDQLRDLAQFLRVPLEDLVIPVAPLDREPIRVTDLLVSNLLLDRFFNAPLDKRLRKWVRTNLNTMFQQIQSEKSELIEHRRRLIELRKAKDTDWHRNRELKQHDLERTRRIVERDDAPPSFPEEL